MCHKKQMIDLKRRYVEISEAYRTPQGTYTLLPVFRFIITRNETDRNGNSVVQGDFKHLNYISNNLAKQMMDNGAPIELIREFARPDYDNERDGDINGEIEKQRILTVAPIVSVSGRDLLSKEAKARAASDKGKRIREMEKKLGEDDTVKQAAADAEIDEAIAVKVLEKKEPKTTRRNQKND